MQDRYRDRIAIEFISALGMPPIDYIQLAAELQCRQIGMALEPIVANTKAYPKWSLRNDSALRRETLRALRENGVSILLGEGFLIWPDKDIRNASADLDLMVELGAKRVNVLSLDPDRGRTIDRCGTFAEQAAARDLDATLEFLPGMPVHDLPGALDVVHQVNRPNFRLLIDAMHFFRSGSDLAQLSLLDPGLVGHVQLCDVPLQSTHANYADEARHDRLQPGEGELPLLDLLVALPPDSVIGLEVPMLAKAEAGIGPHQYLSACIEAAGALMKQADALRAGRNT